MLKMKNLSCRLFCLLLLIVFAGYANAQQREPIYNPKADAQEQLDEAVATAKSENKNVMIQIGGNWCSWCYLFHDFIRNDPGLDSLIDDNYITVHINYSKENYNKPVLESLGFPQRFGFPVFVILDKNGKEIHIQDSALLEEGRGYNRDKVEGFLKNWTTAALDPAKYR